MHINELDGNGRRRGAIFTDEQALRLTVLQRAGGKRLAAADFLRGFPLQPGQVLG